MVKILLKQLMQANDFVFVAEVIALAITLNLILFFLAIGIAQIVRKVWNGKRGADQKQSSAGFSQWATKHFAKLTAPQITATMVVYAAFYLLNMQQEKSRLFIIGANLICSISAFLGSIRELLAGRRKLTREAPKPDDSNATSRV